MKAYYFLEPNDRYKPNDEVWDKLTGSWLRIGYNGRVTNPKTVVRRKVYSLKRLLAVKPTVVKRKRKITVRESVLHT